MAKPDAQSTTLSLLHADDLLVLPSRALQTTMSNTLTAMADQMRRSLPLAYHPLDSSAASLNATLIISSAAYVSHIMAVNTDTAVKYLKLYRTDVVPDPANMDYYTLLPFAPGRNEYNLGGRFFPEGVGFALSASAASRSGTGIGSGHIVGLQIGYRPAAQ